MEKVKKSGQKRKASERKGKTIVHAKNCEFNFGGDKMIAGNISKDRSKINSRQKNGTSYVGDRATTLKLQYGDDVTTEKSDTTQDEETQSEDEECSSDEEQETIKLSALKRKSLKEESASSRKKTKFEKTRKNAEEKTPSMSSLTRKQNSTVKESESENEQNEKTQNEDEDSPETEMNKEPDKNDSRLCDGRASGSSLKTLPTENTKQECSTSIYDDVLRNKIAEKVEIYIRAKKFADAFKEIKKLSTLDDFRLKLLLAECTLRNGMVEPTREAISDLASYISESTTTADELLDWGTMYVKGKKRIDSAKGMVLLACAASLFVNSNDDPNNSVRQVGMCIYHFSNAIRKIPKTQQKSDRDRLPLEKKFNAWSDSLQTFEPIMKEMFRQMMKIEGVSSDKKNSSAAWAQNWMAAAYLYIGHSYLSSAIECCNTGIGYIKEINHQGYDAQKTEIDLYSNLGQASAIMRNRERGIRYINKALKMAKDDKLKCPATRKKDLEKSIDIMENRLKYWK
ncbi:uncharacterized protein LOC120329831 [Styela clava]